MTRQFHPKIRQIAIICAAFLFLFIVVIVNHHISPLIQEIRVPYNEGFAKIDTLENFIIVISQDNKMYLFDWDRLDKAPQIHSLLSEEAVILNTGEILTVWGNRDLRINGFNDKSNQQRTNDLGIEADNYWIKAGSGRKSPVILTQEYGNPLSYMFYRVNPTSLSHYFLFSLDIDSNQEKLKDYEISNQGQYLAVFGQKKGKGWLLLFDLDQEKIVWEKLYEDLRVIPYAVFSKDDKTLFLRDGASRLHQLDIKTGDIIRSYSISRKNPSTENTTSVQDIDISPDGSLVAALVHSRVYIWDIKTGKIVADFTPGHKIESGLCFSPDGRMIATSDLRQGGPIKIWKVPSP